MTLIGFYSAAASHSHSGSSSAENFKNGCRNFFVSFSTVSKVPLDLLVFTLYVILVQNIIHFPPHIC